MLTQLPSIRIRGIGLLLFLCAISQQLNAQQPAEGIRLPIRFAQYDQGYSATNPAAAGYQSFFQASLGHQRQGSNWTQIYTTYAVGSMRLSDAEEDGFHAAGLSLWSDHEGQLLSQTGFYAQYAYHQRILEDLRLSVGFALGGMSFLVQSTDFTPGGGDTRPDGHLGLWVYGDSYFSGFSVNHLFNSRLQPVEQRIRLATHYNFIGGKRFRVNPDLQLLLMAQSRLSSVVGTEADVSLKGIIADKLSFGTSYRINRSFVFIAGLESVQAGWGDLRLNFSYETPTGRSTSPFGVYELTAVYSLDAWR